MLDTISATTRFATSRNRFGVLQRAMDYWRFINSEQLKEVFLMEAFPETESHSVSVPTNIRHRFELPYGERLVIASIVSALKPATVFEFGTFTGATTALIADHCPPNALIHTLDLPQSSLEGTSVSEDHIGTWFRDVPRYANRIMQHRADSRKFDYSSLLGRVDLVYIDGSHEFDDVLSDSRMALAMLSANGTILWDDYQVSTVPVVCALDVLAREVRLERIFGTRLAFHRRSRGS